MNESVAWFGTGLMGLPMAQRLLSAGQRLTVWNRTPEKCQPLADGGAAIATSPAEALAAGEVAMVMLTDAAAVREVLLQEAARSHLVNRTVVNFSTISPGQSLALRDEIERAGGTYIEAPVLGSLPEARDGKLIVMVGATIAQFQRWEPLLQIVGSHPRHVGEVGSAAALKLALNHLIASLTAGFALSLGMVQRSGIAVETFMEVLRASALYAPTFDKKLSRMVDRRYDRPNFPTKHLLKDVRLFLGTLESLGLNGEAAVGLQQILDEAIARGFADSDYAALYEAIAPLERPPEG